MITSEGRKMAEDYALLVNHHSEGYESICTSCRDALAERFSRLLLEIERLKAAPPELRAPDVLKASRGCSCGKPDIEGWTHSWKGCWTVEVP